MKDGAPFNNNKKRSCIKNEEDRSMVCGTPKETGAGSSVYQWMLTGVSLVCEVG